MLQITNQQLQSVLTYERLIPALKAAFISDITVPMRHHHDYKNPLVGVDSTLLLMPAWEASKYLGVKMVTVSPQNSDYQLPSIQGIYFLMDAKNGLPLAMMDAKVLTSIRTAAASALAANFLARKDSDTLLMIGTGALAPQLIAAHASVRPLKKIYIWGRNFEKASLLAQQLKTNHLEVVATKNILDALPNVDIISVATLSNQALVFGKNLKKGQHIDLVGSFKPTMREADDEVMRRGHIYVDTRAGACTESGDILIPLEKGIIQAKDILGDLFELCEKNIFARQHQEEITVFKSVGHALEDLAAAKLVYEYLRE